MKNKIFLMLAIMITTVVVAQTSVNIVLLVEQDITEDITDDGVTITTNVTSRYLYHTTPAWPQISYQNSLGNYPTNAPSVTVSNDIVKDVTAFYQRVNVNVGSIQVLMP